MKKNCIVCDVEFETTQSKAKYCSRACGAKVKYQKGLNSYTFTCQTCGIEYHPKEKSRNKYCSRDCSYKALAKERIDRAARLAEERDQSLAKVCRVCGVGFTASRSDVVFCSDKCRAKESGVLKPERKAKALVLCAIKKNAKPRECKECGKEFTPEYGNKKRTFCTDLCGSRYARRENNKRSGGKEHRHRARHFGVEYEPVNVLKVFARDGWTCQICGCKAPVRLRGKNKPSSPELDHRVPMSKGGGHLYSNVQCACRRCNGAKGNSSNAGQIPLFN